MNDYRDSLDELLTADPIDKGCEAGYPVLDEYVELELSGRDPTLTFPGVSAHLRSCPACRADHDGLLGVAGLPQSRDADR